MASVPPIDKFRQREIEQQLSSEIQTAREQVRTATTEEERMKGSQALERALQRFADFAARNIVPNEFLAG
jgi:hypothetical protein